jgi:hypothetical protein
MPEPICMELDMNIMATESISTAYFTNPSRQSVFVCVPIVARQRLGKRVPAAANTRNNRKIVGCVIFYAVRVLSKERICNSLCVPLSLKGKGSVNTFPRQRRIVGDVLSYSVGVVSKESR